MKVIIKSRTTTVVILLMLALALSLAPLFVLKGAEFGGSDEAGSQMVEQVTGGQYQPWAKPVMETIIGGKLSPEMETLFFCLQTGIGVGILAFCFGYLVARKKYAGGGAERNRINP
ncbi:MAG: energy-coupling factor ABC transporter substrate-binding protein [Firmicutes bacterium]|nr:energy-coupling factor ABC transporter substrate-binding protein [Bacillota bacterium]